MKDYAQEGDQLPLLHLIPLTHRLLKLEDALKEYDLTKSQLYILAAIYYRGCLTMTQVSESISSSKEQATRAVALLVEKGYIKRFELENDRKHVYVELTDAGRQILEAVRTRAVSGFHKKLDNAVSEEEKQQLIESLHTVISILGKVK